MRRALAAAAVVVLALGGCGEPDATDNEGKITVFAAASLAGVLRDLEPRFEREHAGTDIVFSFGGTTGLAQQITAGAPADVFAADAAASMGRVAGVTPTLLARNQLVIAVAPGNPLKIRSLADLAKAKVAICATEVPCGATAQTVLGAAGVKITPAIQELDSRSALTRLTLGEVDAALVYRTDAAAAIGQVDAVEFGESAKAVDDVLVAGLPGAPNPAGAKSFVEFLSTQPATAALREAGFTLP
ncbi:MAG: molybdate ABC transporter substrate-binding protein [Hamadaea sp.]|nr:molybdate ABC transporter substrate-binding protein [Hamadaea sp.]